MATLKTDWQNVFKALGLGTVAINKVIANDITVSFQTGKVVMVSKHGPKTSVPIPSGAISHALKGKLQPMSKQNAAQKISTSLNQLCEQINKYGIHPVKPEEASDPKYPLLPTASAMYQVVTPYEGLPPHIVTAIGDNLILAILYQSSGVLSFAISTATGQHSKYKEPLIELGFHVKAYENYAIWTLVLDCGNDKMLARKTIGAVMFGLGPNIFHSPYPNLDSICA